MLSSDPICKEDNEYKRVLISLRTQISVRTRTHKGFKGTVVNHLLPSLHEDSVNITLTAPLS